MSAFATSMQGHPAGPKDWQDGFSPNERTTAMEVSIDCGKEEKSAIVSSKFCRSPTFGWRFMLFWDPTQFELRHVWFRRVASVLQLQLFSGACRFLDHSNTLRFFTFFGLALSIIPPKSKFWRINQPPRFVLKCVNHGLEDLHLWQLFHSQPWDVGMMSHSFFFTNPCRVWPQWDQTRPSIV